MARTSLTEVRCCKRPCKSILIPGPIFHQTPLRLESISKSNLYQNELSGEKDSVLDSEKLTEGGEIHEDDF